MKKIVLALLLLPLISMGAAKQWLGTTSSSAKNAANWDGGTLPVVNVDTALFTATNNNPCDFDSSFALMKIHAQAGYTSTITNKATFTLQMQFIAIDGAATFAVEFGAPFLLLPQSSGDVWNVHSSATLNGAGTWSWRTNATGITSTCPALPLAMTSGYTVNASPSRNNTIVVYTGNVPSVENFNEYNSRSGITITYKHGSTTHNITGAWNINSSAGAILIDSLQTSTFNVGGNITFTESGTLNLAPGTSLVNVTGAGTTKLAGNRLYDYTINNTGTGYRTHSDACTTSGDFLCTDGKMNMATYPIWSAGDVSIASNDSAKLAKINAGALLYFGPDAITTFTTDSIISTDTAYFAPTNSDSIRGHWKVRRLKIAVGSKFNQTVGKIINCSSAMGVEKNGQTVSVVYSLTGDTNNCNGPLILDSTDSLYIDVGKYIIAQDSIIYNASAKINSGTGAKILTIPGDTLTIKQNALTNKIPVKNRGSYIRWK